MKYKYGEYSPIQIVSFKEWIRKQIFFLLLCVDPKTSNEHKSIDVDKAIESVLIELGGFNSTLYYPDEIVRVTNLLEAARIEYNNPNFTTDDFQHSLYRKLILDAGAKAKEIKEV